MNAEITASLALGGIEFHAKASGGLIENIRKLIKTDQKMDAVITAADDLLAAYKALYVSMREVARLDEIARLSELKKGLEKQ